MATKFETVSEPEKKPTLEDIEIMRYEHEFEDALELATITADPLFEGDILRVPMAPVFTHYNGRKTLGMIRLINQNTGLTVFLPTTTLTTGKWNTGKKQLQQCPALAELVGKQIRVDKRNRKMLNYTINDIPIQREYSTYQFSILG